jgi:hypothetical protein
MNFRSTCCLPKPACIGVVVSSFLLVVSGCGPKYPHVREGDEPEAIQDKEEILKAIDEANGRAAQVPPPKAQIELPTPDGWTKSERRALPPEDHGFSVAYEHRSGITATLYQFTRGRPAISDELGPGSVAAEEMERAKNGIEVAVELGQWQAAVEVDRGIVALGNSTRKALWSRYELTVEDVKMPSDIYVWTRADHIFKLRYTSRSIGTALEKAVLSELLSAFGKASSQ